MTDELMALLAKATAGEWTVDGPPWNQIIWSDEENRVAFLAHSNGLDHERDLATGAAIVAAVDFCRTELPALIEREKALRESLAWALAEIDGNTDYRSGRQQIAAYNRARTVLGASHDAG